MNITKSIKNIQIKFNDEDTMIIETIGDTQVADNLFDMLTTSFSQYVREIWVEVHDSKDNYCYPLELNEDIDLADYIEGYDKLNFILFNDAAISIKINRTKPIIIDETKYMEEANIELKIDNKSKDTIFVTLTDENNENEQLLSFDNFMTLAKMTFECKDTGDIRHIEFFGIEHLMIEIQEYKNFDAFYISLNINKVMEIA